MSSLLEYFAASVSIFAISAKLANIYNISPINAV